MCAIGDVFVVKTDLEHRDTKHCVYVSVSKDYLLYINKFQRPELYDGLEIKKTDKKPWLDTDRYIGCRHFISMEKISLLKQVGRVSFEDIINIRNRLGVYSDKEHKAVCAELDSFIQEADF